MNVEHASPSCASACRLLRDFPELLVILLVMSILAEARRRRANSIRVWSRASTAFRTMFVYSNSNELLTKHHLPNHDFNSLCISTVLIGVVSVSNSLGEVEVGACMDPSFLHRYRLFYTDNAVRRIRRASICSSGLACRVKGSAA